MALKLGAPGHRRRAGSERPVRSAARVQQRRFCFQSLSAILVALLLSGCANRGQVPTGRFEPFNELYSRHLIVCLPTAIGNSIGWVPGIIIAAPFWLVARLVSEPTARKVASPIAGGPTLFGGFVLGTPFLPFSYLAREQACRWEYL